MRNQRKLLFPSLAFIVLISFSYCQDSTSQANALSGNFQSLNNQLNDLLSSSQSLNTNKSSQQHTVALNNLIQTLYSTNKNIGVGGKILSGLTAINQIFSVQNPSTQIALKNLKSSLTNLAGQISNVKSDILNAINQLDQNSALYNIQTSVATLTYLNKEYTSTNPPDLYSYKQICGSYFQICNQAFVNLSQGLSDYISSVKTATGWSKTNVLTNFGVYSSLLISSMTALYDINLQLAVDALKLNLNTLTDQQKQIYSQSTVLYNSYITSYNRFIELLPQLYDTYYVDIQVSKDNYIDFTASSNQIVSGIYRANSGDGVDSIKQAKAGEKDIILQNILIESVQSTLDNNNSWISCPTNSFLRGIYISGDYKLHNIEKIVCNSYQNLYYDQCEIYEIPGFVATNQWANCKDGKFLVGMYKSDGDNISKISKLTCCSVTSKRPSYLSYVDSLQFVKTQYNPKKTNIDMTNGSKQPISYFNIKQAQLQGDLEVGFTSGFTVDSTKDADVLHTFDDALNTGQCPQDYFMYGFYQNDGTNFSHIEKLNCVKYKNTYWNQCFSQVISTDSNYWKCNNQNDCKSSFIPKQARCQDGSFLVGLRRNSINNMYGLDQIVCCSTSSTSGLYKN